jgi:23S rRNA pseudouridine2605 synthase
VPEGDARQGVRLQKVMASAGVGSRRACEALIEAGRVQVNGRVVAEQGMRVDPATAEIKVDGLRISTPEAQQVYLALNKPLGVLSSMSDDRGRMTLTELLPDRVRDGGARLFHVGRLDNDTEGLLLLTNDGELAHRLTHPSYEVPKTYVAEILAPVPRDLGKRLRAGYELEDGHAALDTFKVVGASGNRVMVEVTLHEGRNRLVRRLLEEAGHPVQRLIRVGVGPVSLGELRPGKTRPLNSQEIGQLYQAVGM